MADSGCFPLGGRMVLVTLCSMVTLAAAIPLGKGHRLTSVYEFPNGQGFVADLELIEHTDTYGPDIDSLRMVVRFEGNKRVHVHISDHFNTRWEVPQDLIQRPQPLPMFVSDPHHSRLLEQHSADEGHLLNFSYTSNPFGFAITRRSNGEVLFNSTTPLTTGNGLVSFNSMVFKDQYLEISTQLPKNASLFGLGEHTQSHGLELTPGLTYTLWAADIPAYHTDVDLYGSQPSYMDVRKGGISHGVLLLNSNGMDVYYGDDFLTYHVLGGVLDFYFFAGPSPLDVVNQLTKLVGRPAPMPYWSFGFHQCRWGYQNLSHLKYVVDSYKKANIPLDTIWNDIDYMEAYKDFTLDPVNYPEHKLREFVQDLHANGQQYVVILDPAISINHKNYTTLERGLKDDIFLKDELGENYLAQVWPGPVYFPDFLHPKTQSWWSMEVADLHKKVPFDGLWIDMNEASNFCSGSTCSFDGIVPLKDMNTCYLECTKSTSKWDNPPYKIDYWGQFMNIGEKTVAMNVRHYTGALEYDAHNLYGLSETIVTHKALKALANKRPFILSRSTFLGSGAYAAHWTGDNAATWKNLEYSIPSILNSGMLGVPMVGADICGFSLDTTEELCNRWIQLGAFYPFSRDHSELRTIPQELYEWEIVAVSARNALGMRYRLLPYLYTLMFEAHKKGSPIARPLFFAFPGDPTTLHINTQFLLGNSIMVSPVVSPGVLSVTAYFPKGTWYNMFNFSKVVSRGSYHTLAAPIDAINVHVHEGSIVPMQDRALTAARVRKSPFTLLVALPSNDSPGSARGNLFLDNGIDSEMKVENGKSTIVRYYARTSVGKGNLTARVSCGEYALEEGWVVQTVVILGVTTAPKNFVINGHPVSSLKITFDTDVPSLEISGLHLHVGKDFDLVWESSS